MKRLAIVILAVLAGSDASARDDLELYIEGGDVVGYGLTDPATGQIREYDAENNLIGSAVRAKGYIYHYDLSGRLFRVTRPNY